MQEDHYIELLNKKLSGGLGTEEKLQLDSWLQASSDHQLIADSMEKAWNLSENYSQELELDEDMDFALLQKRIAEEEGTNQEETVVKQLPSRRKWLQIAAGFLLLIAASYLIRQAVTDQQEWEQLTTARGQTKEVALPDGSTAWLNQNSTIHFPNTFTSNERRIKLEGEAFFEVQKNPDQVFIVETDQGHISVLGTSFNVRQYPDEDQLEVQVRTGKVKMEIKGKGHSAILEAEEKGVYRKSEDTLSESRDVAMNALSWHSRRLSFIAQALKQVIQDVERMYQIEVTVSDPALLNCPFTATFNDKKPEVLLATIASVFNMKVASRANRKYTLSGGTCQ